jgi:branched-chain amino acid transport system substrate-binding protein
MKPSKHTRRAFNVAAIAGVATLTGVAGITGLKAQQKTIKVGITLPLTGADAEDALLIKNGAMMAIDEANAKGGVAGYKIEVVTYDSGTATAGQYDPAQAATNTKKLISDLLVVANIGPQMSGEGKAMTPILSQADLATITPSSTNPDITDPKMAAQFKPKGKAIYFRTVTTDAFQSLMIPAPTGLESRMRSNGRRRRTASRSWDATSSTQKKPTTRLSSPRLRL